LDVAELIREYQNLFYAITFGWAFIEGESFVIFAGAAAFKGDLNIYILILAAWLGSFCGDQCWFALGRFFGAKLLVRLPKLKAGVAVAMDMVEKYDVLFILSFRFIYGVRNVASPALGMNGYPWLRFAVFNFIAAFIWANSFAWGGYILAKAFEELLGDISENFGYVMLAVFAIVCCILFFVHRSGQKRFKRMQAQAQSEDDPAGAAQTASGAPRTNPAGGGD